MSREPEPARAALHERGAAEPGRATAEVVARLRSAGCVFAEDEAGVLLSSVGSQTELDAWVARRVAGEPLEQIVGWAQFCGLRIAVRPGVFVPRLRTELLVREAATLLRQARAVRGGSGGERPVVVDLCCGSGAVGVALAVLAGPVEVHAADLDPAAVDCAGSTLAGLAAMAGDRSTGQAYLGDLFEPLPPRLRGTVDALVVNAPYVPTAQIALMPPEARLHEPITALDGGPDGLDVARRAVAAAPDWLAPGGQMLVETSARQAPALRELMAAAGLPARVVSDSDLDATAVIGWRPRP
ncbi:MAG TPA: putative protein N(5)-glutamine methyltransferase [Kineosporiaceae bacterium]|nr:putative protein N(5)-glutamine methyltransferase [Kineosporiaceae bacterium]